MRRLDHCWGTFLALVIAVLLTFTSGLAAQVSSANYTEPHQQRALEIFPDEHRVQDRRFPRAGSRIGSLSRGSVQSGRVS